MENSWIACNNIVILFCIENMRFIYQCHFVHNVIATFFRRFFELLSLVRISISTE